VLSAEAMHSLLALALALAAAPKAHVTLVKSSASANDAAIAKELKSQASGLHDCYDLALKDTPALKGTVSLTFQVEPTAGVTTLTVADDSLTDETLVSCVKARLSTTWPKVKKAVTVHATYRFETK
jgi:hypothetical protein